MKRFIILGIILIFLTQHLYTNGSAGSDAVYETRYIIDMPNAGMLPKHSFNVNIRAFHGGGLATEFLASPFENFMIGIAYSGNGIIGEGEPEAQGIPGFDIRYRVFDERLNIPAFVIGIRTQGSGGWIDSEERFTTLSPGAFLAVSKNFEWFLGEIALHGGINYSFEAKPEDRLPNLYGGFEFTAGPFASVVTEINFNLDDADQNISEEKGTLNAGVRFSITNNITIDLLFKDILKHRKGADTPLRSINFEMISYF